MKVIFISNYLNHHQKSLCDNLYNLLNGEFLFIATSVIGEERIKLGYEKVMPQYVSEYIEHKSDLNYYQQIIDDADVVIYGSAPYKLIKNRIVKNKVIIRYSERVNKNGVNLKMYFPRAFLWNLKFPFWKKIYLLSASGYAKYDYNLYGLFYTNAYKWGYFPEDIIYNVDALQKGKNRKKILWCGRFIELKHPEVVVEIAKKLKNEGYLFDIDFIGMGNMQKDLQYLVKQNGLDDVITFLGTMKPKEVLIQMQYAGIFLATSDFNEGWGAVINEAMNSGCAVVASHAIGAVPFLINHKENGLIYKSGDIDDLYKKVKYLLDNLEIQESLGIKAYGTINTLWNSRIAAERLIKFSEEILDHGYCDIYDEGPCSKAETIKNNWFTGDV